MRRPNLGYYVTMVNTIVTDTEKIGASLHSDFELIRTAIDQEQTATVEEAKRLAILENFQTGTQKYQEMLAKIKQLTPPATIMGIHKTFERAYTDYVAGCEAMVASVTDTIQPAAFNAAELAQDQATDEIAGAIQKMTQKVIR